MGMIFSKTFSIAALTVALTGSAMAQDWDGSFATDFDLEMVAYAAYNGAREYALTHDNYSVVGIGIPGFTRVHHRGPRRRGL